jgi:hypothetical protein
MDKATKQAMTKVIEDHLDYVRDKAEKRLYMALEDLEEDQVKTFVGLLRTTEGHDESVDHNVSVIYDDLREFVQDNNEIG